MKNLSLYHIAQDYVSAFYAMAESDFDETTISDTLEGLDGEANAKCVSVAAFILNTRADIDALKAAEKRIADRRKPLDSLVARLEKYLLENMQKMGFNDVSADDSSFRVRVMAGSESVVIDDEASLPPDYLRTKSVSEPNKVLIKQAIKDGHEVPGAHVERKPSLKID